MKQVFTTKGLVDFDLLEVSDTVTHEDNARVIKTQWRFKGENEVVRQDIAVSILRALEVEPAANSFA